MHFATIFLSFCDFNDIFLISTEHQQQIYSCPADEYLKRIYFVFKKKGINIITD